MARGCRLGVVSSKAAENIGACLTANGAFGPFDLVVGHPRLFGKGAVLRRPLMRQGFPPGGLPYVGGEVRDVRAARRAGADSAAVARGFWPPELLARLSLAHLWSGPGEALAVLLAFTRADSA
jgi:phosphoglycolate phosphatase